MSRRHAAPVILLLLAGCLPDPAPRLPMTVHGLAIERIEPGHQVILADGLTIAGDARLTDALAAGGAAIRELVVLERMPPVLVVTFADGEVRRYQSRTVP